MFRFLTQDDGVVLMRRKKTGESSGPSAAPEGSEGLDSSFPCLSSIT